MKIIMILVALVALTGCGNARIESGRSLRNAEEAVNQLLTTQLSEGQQRIASAISVAMNPAIDYLEHNWRGARSPIKATVPQQDWANDPLTAEKGVIYQAARADAANSAQFTQTSTWTSLFWSGVGLLFGAGGLATVKKIFNLKGALGDAIKFGNEALHADTPDAKVAVKERAIERKRGTKHAAELDYAMVRVRSG